MGADWCPAAKQHDIAKEPASTGSDAEKGGASALQLNAALDQDCCSTECDYIAASASCRSHVAHEEPLQLNACKAQSLSTPNLQAEPGTASSPSWVASTDGPADWAFIEEQLQGCLKNVRGAFPQSYGQLLEQLLLEQLKRYLLA